MKEEPQRRQRRRQGRVGSRGKRVFRSFKPPPCPGFQAGRDAGLEEEEWEQAAQLPLEFNPSFLPPSACFHAGRDA